MSMRFTARGFTLVELVITVAIIALLATAALPAADLASRRVKEQELTRALRQVRDAIDAYKQAADEGRIAKNVGESGYPKRLEDLVAGVDDRKSTRREKIYFLRRIPRDPFNAEAELAPPATWGKRSYASPPDDPKEGDDVFDVYSLSGATGLNGRPYREW
ncbi:MAG TPA: type II secretion system protein [Burkholderiales bacterium]